jgi:hypothetical protein
MRIDGDTWQRCLDIDAMREMVSASRVDEARRTLLDCLLDGESNAAHPAREQGPQ